ncbi:MAG: hypothetical protein GY746_02515 [Gammaproteobacteria bacterium]|nr:hypothetical protein [Gammaproteobacteria bacterium]
MTSWLIKRSDISITVHADGETACNLVETTLSGMRPEYVDAASGMELTVSASNDDWCLLDHSTDKRLKLNSTGGLIYQLTDHIVTHLADNIVSKLCLHAASVSLHNHAIIIPATSGSGKSLLTAWLTANGFDFITDELTFMDDNFSIDGLARPILIKSHGLDAVTPLLKSNGDAYPGRHVTAIPVAGFGGKTCQSSTNKLGMILFPTYRESAGFELRKMAAGTDASMKLIANQLNAKNLGGTGFRSMIQMIRSTPLYTLTYGGFHKLPDDFTLQLKNILHPQ